MPPGDSGCRTYSPGTRGNAEASLFIRLELCNLDTIPTEDRQRRLIRLVGAFLTLLDDRTHGSNQYLPFDSTAPRRGAVNRAGGEDEDQYTNQKI